MDNVALTRSQLLMGDSGQGTVLDGQVQGVKAGSGILIANDGTISFNASSSLGVVRTNNNQAYNGYIWPSIAPTDNSFPVVSKQGSDSFITWNPVPLYGIGLAYAAPNLKVSIPALESAPFTGEELDEAIEGTIYWNSSSKRLFIRNSGSWQAASYGPDSFNVSLLTGKHHLYVNPEIGSDYYIEGIYSSNPGEDVITKQESKYGYTPQKPFKTIQRAALEAARIQNGASFNPLFYDRIIIHCSAGEHIVDNAKATGSVSGEWANNSVPTAEQLRNMNDSGYAGVILPRGVSIVGEDVRKTIIRPTFVPSGSGNIETDRASIFRVTGGAFFFNFTFKDKLDHNFTHHLLDCFSFVSEADLEDYYSKVQIVFQQVLPNFIAEPGENEIVAPFPQTNPSSSTDGVIGSSPYVFNCAIRSRFGLCGINADGSQVTGFKSIVVAQFTGVSLQKDLSCWQWYNSTSKQWESGSYTYSNYVAETPNDIRMNPEKRSFHIRAINDAFIQEVSVFAIGQGVHHWVHSGGEISITNSNSTFGGCAAIAEGYKNIAFPQDRDWSISYINVATNLEEDTDNVTRIYLGTIANSVPNNATTLVLTDDLIDSELYPGIPEILARRNYSFKEDSYLWVENPIGFDFRAPLAISAWDPDLANEIKIKVPMVNEQGTSPGGTSPPPSGITQPNLIGSRVYIRRLVDVRPDSRRKYSIDISTNNSSVRTPTRDYILQTSPELGGVSGYIPEEDITLVSSSASIPPGNLPSLKRCQIVLNRANPVNEWVSGQIYRPGDTIRRENKHYTCVLRNSDIAFDPYHWNESYVHMPSEYNAYDFPGNATPVIIFDNDTDGQENSSTCGYNLNTVWSTDPEIISQYRSASDYRGVYQFLIGLGFSPADATTILLPSLSEDRKLNTASSSDMKGKVPDGIATGLANWPVEFRRPSLLRMFSHSWEWAGFLNYTKALPPFQGELSPQNQFNYYFTNSLGGKVYATGYNQEGYLITPAGLTDLATNTTIGVASLGSPNQGEFPNSFDSLTVNNLTITGSVSGSPTFSPAFYTNLLTGGLGIQLSAPILKVKIPVLSSPPSIGSGATSAITGSLYWDATLATLFILYDDGNSTQWVQAVPSGGGGAGGTPVIISPTPPSTSGLSSGSLYWDSTLGLMFVLYDDGDSIQWVQTVPSGGGSGSESCVTVSSTPPPTSGLPQGSLYWNTVSETLYVLYDDGVTVTWKIAVPNVVIPSLAGIGSYGFFQVPTSAVPGDVLPGSSLEWSGSGDNPSGIPANPSGSWRCHGEALNAPSSQSTLFIRVA